jgi:hypothetical protein
MIPTMTPVREMPSSTRLTTTFTPPNTKSIAPQGAPALQQRQGLTTKTLLLLNEQINRHLEQSTHGATKEARLRARKLLQEKTDLLNYYISLLRCWDWLYGASRAELREDYKEWLLCKGYSSKYLGGFNAINAFVRSRTLGQATNLRINFQGIKTKLSKDLKTLNAGGK